MTEPSALDTGAEFRREELAAEAIALDGGLLAGRREHLDGECECPLLGGVEGPDADHLTGNFLAAVVADRQHHGILPRPADRRVRDRPFNSQRQEAWLRARPHRGGVEPQMVPTSGTHAGAFEDGRPAVRTGARGTGSALTHGTHGAKPLSRDIVGFFGLLSSQPNSTCPRMREPAATVREPALRSPLNTPVSSNSTRDAPSMLPSSSPPMITVLARTAPVSLAPASIVRLPWTCTSPLKRPAMRTWPEPSILPSIVRSAAITDSFDSRSVAPRGES